MPLLLSTCIGERTRKKTVVDHFIICWFQRLLNEAIKKWKVVRDVMHNSMLCTMLKHMIGGCNLHEETRGKAKMLYIDFRLFISCVYDRC